MYTPLVILSTRNGPVTTERSRSRPTPEEFYINLLLELTALGMENPDEIVVRILRPTAE